MESFQLCHSQNIILISNFPNCLPYKVSSNTENFEGVSVIPGRKITQQEWYVSTLPVFQVPEPEQRHSVCKSQVLHTVPVAEMLPLADCL